MIDVLDFLAVPHLFPIDGEGPAGPPIDWPFTPDLVNLDGASDVVELGAP